MSQTDQYDHIRYAYEDTLGVEQQPINDVFGDEQKMSDPTLEQWMAGHANSDNRHVENNIGFVLTEPEALQMIFGRVIPRENGAVTYRHVDGNLKSFSLEISDGVKRRVSLGCMAKTFRLSWKLENTVCCSIKVISKKETIPQTILNPTVPTCTPASKPYMFERAWTEHDNLVNLGFIDLTIDTNSELINDDECASGVRGHRGSMEVTGTMSLDVDSEYLKEYIKKRRFPMLDLVFFEEKRHEYHRQLILKLSDICLTLRASENLNRGQRNFNFKCNSMRVTVHDKDLS